jgi:1-acyl-sn-glycerol-3-phosphate acyltransferase
VAQRRLGFWRRLAVTIVLPPLRIWTKPTWTGQQNLPQTGGVILVSNHVSHFDPLVVAHYVYKSGRWPRFLTKASLWRIPLLGPFLDKTLQIPVERGSVEAVKSLDVLVEALRQDGAVVIYPEGTTTREPDLWPMRGKTGAARLALQLGLPVIPVAHWGTQDLMPNNSTRLRLRPRARITVLYGDPVDLSDLGRVADKHALATATDRIMAAITGLLEELRGETAPPERWDPAKRGQPETGRF